MYLNVSIIVSVLEPSFGYIGSKLIKEHTDTSITGEDTATNHIPPMKKYDPNKVETKKDAFSYFCEMTQAWLDAGHHKVNLKDIVKSSSYIISSCLKATK